MYWDEEEGKRTGIAEDVEHFVREGRAGEFVRWFDGVFGCGRDGGDGGRVVGKEERAEHDLVHRLANAEEGLRLRERFDARLADGAGEAGVGFDDAAFDAGAGCEAGSCVVVDRRDGVCGKGLFSAA